VLAVDPGHPDPAAIGEAVAVLAAGGLVAFPTETFYGLGAAALNPAAADRIYTVKGRPDESPLLVLVDSVEMAETIAHVPAVARPLMARHWPGPLTLVMVACPCVPTRVTAGTGTVGVRVSSHPVAIALVRRLGEPITAPSANRAGGPPPVSSEAVLAALGAAVDVVLDGGATRGGPPSTVLDVTVSPPRVIRPGAVAL
jgi:L-threonylcarbamoyladenylate synthase